MKNRILSFLLCTALVSTLVVLPASPAVAAAENAEIKQFHVAPNGSNANSGTEAAPLDSMESAKKAVASYKKSNPNTPVEVIFHEGTYHMEEEVYFVSTDSGTENGPITYKAADGEKVIFKGSREIDTTKIKKVGDASVLSKIPAEARGKVGQIDLAAQGFDDLGEMKYGVLQWPPEAAAQPPELFLNGELQQLASYPNGTDEYLQFDSVVATGGTGGNGTMGGTFTTADYRLLRWSTAKDAMIEGFPNNDFTWEKFPIASIDVAKKEVTLGKNSIQGLSMSYTHRYRITNLLEELDMPGEYYIDRDEFMLYYYPENTLKDSTLELSVMADNFIHIRALEYVNFEGITFSQGRANGIFIQETYNNGHIKNCTFENIAVSGIYQRNFKQAEIGLGTETYSQFSNSGMMNVHIDNNIFTTIGVSALDGYFGVRDTCEFSNSTVNNNYIYSVGRTNRVSNALIVNGIGVEVANNTIHQIGWGVRFSGNAIDIHHNEVYDYMNNVNDGGGIYCGRNFINRGNQVHHNYVHDGTPKNKLITRNMSQAIYNDDMNAGTHIHHNILVDGGLTGVATSGGMSLNVHDNIVVGTENSFTTLTEGYLKEVRIPALRSQGEKALTFPAFAAIWGDEIRADLDKAEDVSGYNIVKDNVYYRSKAEFSEKALSINEVSNNLEATESDFVDAANGDYRLKKSSALAAANDCLDEDFDLNSIGVDWEKMTENLVFGKDFHLKNPANNTLGLTSEKITFNWQRPVGADKFRLVVARDWQMTDIVHDITTYETTYVLDGFENDGAYYWKVYAENESGNETLRQIEILESYGVPHLFTIAKQYKKDKTDIQATIIAAKEKLGNIVEGEGVGQYLSGTKQALSEKIELAEKILEYGGYSEEDEKAVIEDIENLTNSDSFINGGYVDLGDYFTDVDNWKVGLTGGLDINNKERVLNLSAIDTSSHAVCGYTGFTDYSRVLAISFKMKFTLREDGSGWVGMGLRGKSPINYTYTAGNDQYFLTLKEGIVEYQKNSGGTNTLLETVEDENVKTGEWLDVDFGVINLGDVGQLTILKINGEVAYQQVDTSANQVMNKGTFQLIAAQGTAIEVQPAGRELGDFGELIAEYTFNMTTDLCKLLEKENDSENSAFIGVGSKKSYYGGELHDVAVPAVGEGEAMMISPELATAIFGATAVNSQVKDANGMVSVKATAEAAGMTTYFYMDKQMVFIAKNIDFHTANYGRQFNNVSKALAMYK